MAFRCGVGVTDAGWQLTSVDVGGGLKKAVDFGLEAARAG
jgi:hypothetical protein